jgi:hypothetical protein
MSQYLEILQVNDQDGTPLARIEWSGGQSIRNVVLLASRTMHSIAEAQLSDHIRSTLDRLGFEPNDFDWSDEAS